MLIYILLYVQCSSILLSLFYTKKWLCGSKVYLLLFHIFKMPEKGNKKAMTGNRIDRDLCSTCKSADMCSFSGNHKHPIFYCDEFGHEESSCRKKIEEPPATSDEKLSASNKNKIVLNNYKGLCMNCENSETCTHPKPIGGVWHCNEYL